MTIEQVGIVDKIAKDNETGVVDLIIFDHLEWGDNDHLYKLQEKINKYLAYLESGEVYDAYPNLSGERFGILVICKYDPDPESLNFLRKVKEVILGANFLFKCMVKQDVLSLE
jgi:hypothetical protein